MSDFRFADPQFVHALWGVAALAMVLIALERRAGSQFRALVSDALKAQLVVGPTAGQRYARHAFLILACVFSVLALMRPQWGTEFVKSPRASAELMIALDVSRSMLAEDVAPNRLERAKSEVRDLLDFLVGDRVGLIAFAGRASVLAPMTPDFGFIRLVLDSVGPNSVGRGGTRLEEPIRKAIAGFKATGDVARVLLLITDGEDQDSFPIEAAKEAALRGIRIIAIGFGSESGSEIPITDPETGARILLRDSDGEIVRTRLDGDTLREMALLTDGVYVPAGVGALDLESIYSEHIAGLMRAEIDDEGRVIRGEGFQWFVLAAIICLVISVSIGQVHRAPASPLASASLLCLVLLSAPVAVRAQTGPASPQAVGEASLSASPDPPTSSTLAAENTDPALTEAELTLREEEPAGDPRENYNLALEALEVGRMRAAMQHFENVRSGAGTDGEARYRATYGLGWGSVIDADGKLESAPQEALELLYRAGDFFREAVRLQPANEDPRHNLEIVLRRARALADSLAKDDERDLAERLDELITRQRVSGGDIRGLLERVELADQGAQLADSFRRDFRTLATQQRQLLSDSDHFAERVDRERAGLEATPEEQRSPEDSTRIVQLRQLEVYLQRARERMGHARRELRGRRGERAYRRANTALAELKRARDQLRDPVQILDALLRDGSELARHTGTRARLGALGSATPGTALNAGALPEAPPWLTLALLREGQQSLGERTSELNERLLSGMKYAEQLAQAAPSTQEEAAQLAEQQRVLEQVAAASPLVGEADAAFAEALIALEVEDEATAVRSQRRGLTALAEARERFLDLRRLIEVSYADQRRLQGVIDPEGPDPSEALRKQMSELTSALLDLQRRNLSRAARLQEMIDDERASLPEPQSIDPSAQDERERAEQAKLQYQLADQILRATEASMRGVVDGLEPQNAGDPSSGTWRAAIVAGDEAVKGLEHLRRLFFSIIELLRETAERQTELGDATEEVAARPEEWLERGLGPLIPRQAELAEIAGVIANTLEEQSRQQPGDLIGGNPDPDANQRVEAEKAVNLRRAAELVLEGQIEMESAGVGLEAKPTEFTLARDSQDLAIARLLEALELLSPPAEDQNQDQQNQDQQQQDQQQQQAQQQQAGEQERERQEADPSQMLQEVRDREALRRREKSERNQRSFDTVERDW
jgi:Ca-activated chloride channel family protein